MPLLGLVPFRPNDVISAQGGVSMKFHFFTDWLNAVSILLSLFCVQHHHSTQYNFREEDSLDVYLFVCMFHMGSLGKEL